MELPFANASQGEASKYAEDLFSFLEDHNAIHSMHPEDYFAELPKMSPRLQEWTQSLGSVIADSPGFEAVPHLLQVEDTTTPPWWTVLERAPEVLAFARRCVQLRLNRDVEVDPAKCVRFDGAPTPGVPELARKRLHRLTDGMKSKKQHEVGQMYEAVTSMVDEAGKSVNTVINVGEGKGYLSRSLALCGGLQSVGLDCNPRHRDNSFERIDRTLCAVAEDGDSFLYAPRGEMLSVTCRVGDSLAWDSILPQIEPEQVPLEEAPPSKYKRKCVHCHKILRNHLPMLIGHVSSSHPSVIIPQATNGASLTRWIAEHYRDSDVVVAAQYGRGVRLRLNNKTAEPEVVTVLGFSDSSGCHKVLRHSDWSRTTMNLPHDAEVIPEFVPSRYAIPPNLSTTVMIGLHTCGDLGSSILRLWLKSKSPRLMLVSCCWHSLSSAGFPMSRLAMKSGFRASPLTFMLATHPITERLTANLLKNYINTKRLLFYRALLWVLWQGRGSVYSCRTDSDSDSALPALFLRDVSKGKDRLCFPGFVREVHRARLAPKGSDEDEDVAKAAVIEREHADAFFPFLSFLIFRAWMSQVVEMSLLLDRCLFLTEELSGLSASKGPHVKLFPLFDAYLSPRNYAIVARK